MDPKWYNLALAIWPQKLADYCKTGQAPHYALDQALQESELYIAAQIKQRQEDAQ